MSEAVGSIPSLTRSGAPRPSFLRRSASEIRLVAPAPTMRTASSTDTASVTARHRTSTLRPSRPRGSERSEIHAMLLRLVLVVAFALAGSGCAYRVEIAAPPAQAETTRVFAADGSV